MVPDEMTASNSVATVMMYALIINVDETVAILRDTDVFTHCTERCPDRLPRFVLDVCGQAVEDPLRRTLTESCFLTD